ncbi:uncharacterized protein [Onthophagus taurus]|nr:uncharacterized protein LOC111413147 isoform X2 [Onthophagus taurus]
MVRKTDQRTFASMKKGEQPKLETITRETIETFRGPKTEYKVTTEKRDEQKSTEDLIISIVSKKKKPQKTITPRKRKPIMDFNEECLKAHNQYREKHDAEPLKLNAEMCKSSQSWADELMKRGVLEHSPGTKYGENIYCVQSTNVNFIVPGNEPVDNWYKESKMFIFGEEPFDLSSGHFTQVVWKDSKHLGIGMAKQNGRVIVVCNYYPPGNVVGEFSNNVFPITTHSDDSTSLEQSLSNLVVNSEHNEVQPTPKESESKKINDIVKGDFQNDFLIAHNDYRAKHGVEGLLLDENLCKQAQKWAEDLAARNVLEHRKNSPYGENIYCMYSSDPNFKITGHTPVDTWYEEKKDHPFGKEPTSLKTGHFTQVIWKNSKLLGVGWAKSRQGYIYVVANYNPAGNFVGEYVKNVPDVIDETQNQLKQENGDHAAANSLLDGSPLSEISSEFSQFQLDALKIHNEFRRKHGVPPLKLNKELCDQAKSWATECARLKQMSHRRNNKYGENIFSMYSSDFSHEPSARDVIRKWYDEVEEYTFGAEKINFGTLHFTQVVWRGTTEFGIDMAKNDKGYTYVVANYKPRGNIVGQFVANVSAPKIKSQWSVPK